MTSLCGYAAPPQAPPPHPHWAPWLAQPVDAPTVVQQAADSASNIVNHKTRMPPPPPPAVYPKPKSQPSAETAAPDMQPWGWKGKGENKRPPRGGKRQGWETAMALAKNRGISFDLARHPRPSTADEDALYRRRLDEVASRPNQW